MVKINSEIHSVTSRQKLYTAFSVFQFVWMLLLRLACIVGLVFIVPNYNENPVLIILASALCFLFLLILGDDEITVYQDSVIQTTNSIWNFIFKAKGTTIKISEIKIAYLEKRPAATASEITVALILASFLPKQNKWHNRGHNKSTPVFFELQNGATIEMLSDLEITKLEKIVELVNGLAYKV
jgi:hypothetical protein